MTYEGQDLGEIALFKSETVEGIFSESLRAEAHRDIINLRNGVPSEKSLPELRRLHDDHGSHQARVLRGMVVCDLVVDVLPNGIVTNYDSFMTLVNRALNQGKPQLANDISRVIGMEYDWFLGD